ncbi:MAG: transcription elongation factor GreA [Ruminococcaceae bacterium]|nr:transcription elongation factor GreA [Oscillospiraceae bacterium]
MGMELTKIDIQKINEEIEERLARNPALREEVKRTRAFGDLSENDEYRSAKREFNKNRSRIRYLRNLLETAVVIDVKSEEDTVGLFDEVEVYYPEDEETATLRIVTTLRNDVLNGLISKESPFGKAILGRRVGETVTVQVNEKVSYPVEIRSIKKMDDDPTLPIQKY